MARLWLHGIGRRHQAFLYEDAGMGMPMFYVWMDDIGGIGVPLLTFPLTLVYSQDPFDPATWSLFAIFTGFLEEPALIPKISQVFDDRLALEDQGLSREESEAYLEW